MSEHINKTASNIINFLEKLEGGINSLSAGETLPATSFAKTVGKDFGFNWQQAYHIINAYIDQRPELEVAKGPKGGIRFRMVREVAKTSSVMEPKSSLEETFAEDASEMEIAENQ